MYCIYSEGTDQAVSVLWRIWQSSVFPWDHLKRSGSERTWCLMYFIEFSKNCNCYCSPGFMIIPCFRMSPQTSLSAASYWSSPCQYGHYRRCCPTPLWMRYDTHVASSPGDIYSKQMQCIISFNNWIIVPLLFFLTWRHMLTSLSHLP